MSNVLDIDKNIMRWIPAFKAYQSGETCVCPICESDEIEAIGQGWLLLTCKKCGKSGYFSRVIEKSGSR